MGGKVGQVNYGILNGQTLKYNSGTGQRASKGQSCVWDEKGWALRTH